MIFVCYFQKKKKKKAYPRIVSKNINARNILLASNAIPI